MPLTFFLVQLICVSLLCAAPQRDKTFLPFESLTREQAIKKSQDDGKPILMYFHAAWCGICHTMNQMVWPDEDLQNMMTAFRVLDMYDGEEGVYQERVKYKINSFPSLVFLNPKGEKITKFGGMLPADNLIMIANKILDEYPTKGPRPKVRSAEQKLPLDWFVGTLNEMKQQGFEEDRPLLLLYLPESQPNSNELSEAIKTNLNLRRLMKFFLIKDLALDQKLNSDLTKQYELNNKPALIFLSDQLEKFGILFFEGSLENFLNDMQSLMNKIAQIFNDRLTRRIHQQIKKETELQNFKPRYLPHYLIYEFKQFDKQDAVLIFAENQGLRWLTEGDFLEGHRILDIQVENQKLLIQVDAKEAVFTSGVKNKSVSVENFIPLTAINSKINQNHSQR